ncbi:MAG TPA: tRNA lysidine(34) synthetase TilS [Clostridiales bacterium]|nr:tRNA lysidine(34) synthetase TilS [Clostridiales bacterium]
MLKKHVLETIKKYNLIDQNDKIVCAVSGGPDSICMLDVLRRIKEENKINFDIIVCHVNHMIRVEATADEQYVENYCKKYQIPFFAKRVDVKKIAESNKQGTEEAGRKVRYDFFEEIFQKENATKIAIAHNKNDKIETIIMNVFRGSGISGLRGIEPVRENKFIRPLIEIERTDIEKYCEENRLNPRIDKTNFINDVTRNKIRNIVIPYIKNEFNPNFINTLDRLSNVITEEDEYMKKRTIEVYTKIKIQEKEGYIVLDLKEFNKQEEVIRKRLIIYTIAQTIGSSQNIEKVNIEDIIKLCSNNIGNKYLTPNKNIKISVGKGQVVFEKI